MAAAEGAGGVSGPSAAEASRRRIAAGAGRWYQVLGISIAAAPDEVKTAYRSLALLHHPDKGGDADTFKQVKQAYEEGMLKTRMRAQRCVKASQEKARAKSAAASAGKPKAKAQHSQKQKPKSKGKAKAKPARATKAKEAPPPAEAAAPAADEAPSEAARAPGERGAGGAPAPSVAAPQGEPASSAAGGSIRGKKRPRAAPVPFDAPRTKLRQALRRWETSKEARTMPDDIPVIEPPEVSAMLRKHACVLVDVREDGECAALGRCPDAVRLSFVQLMSEPEVVVQQVAKLHTDERKLILFSQHAERFGKCGLLGTMLQDVFGFDDSRVFRMGGGYARWREFVEGDPVLHAEEELARALSRKGEAEARAEAARGELDEWESAAQRHFDPLLSGSWQAASEASALLAQLGPRLPALGAEESLKAMLAVAVGKRHADRGPWDTIVLEELGERLTAKVDALRALQQELSDAVAGHDAAVEAAMAKLAAARDGAAEAEVKTEAKEEDVKEEVKEEVKAEVKAEMKQEPAEVAGDNADAEGDARAAVPVAA